jgi:hypothetical protein
MFGDGVNNLRVEGFVIFVVGAENGAGNGVETDDFYGLMVGESGRMNRECLMRLELMRL